MLSRYYDPGVAVFINEDGQLEYDNGSSGGGISWSDNGGFMSDYFSGFGSDSGGWFGGIFGNNPGGGLNIDLGGLGDILTGGGGGGVPDTSETLTQIVNGYEAALQANLAAWQQQQIGTSNAIERGWALMNQLVQRCTAYGAEGLKAVAERDRRVDPARLRWDWIAYYIDPINGGPTPAQPLPTIPGGLNPGGTNPGYTTAGFGSNDWMLVGAALLGLWYISKQK